MDKTVCIFHNWMLVYPNSRPPFLHSGHAFMFFPIKQILLNVHLTTVFLWHKHGFQLFFKRQCQLSASYFAWQLVKNHVLQKAVQFVLSYLSVVWTKRGKKSLILSSGVSKTQRHKCVEVKRNVDSKTVTFFDAKWRQKLHQQRHLQNPKRRLKYRKPFHPRRNKRKKRLKSSSSETLA